MLIIVFCSWIRGPTGEFEEGQSRSGADWSACLPGGSKSPVTLKCVKRLTPLTGKGYEGRGEKVGRDKVTKGREKGGNGTGEGTKGPLFFFGPPNS